MSRFGLRSHSDGFKLSEEKANSKKLCRSAKVALKKVYQKKKKSPLFNSDVESKEDPAALEKSCTPEDRPPVMSLVCSLPLNRISGFIKKLNAANSTANVNLPHNADELKQEEQSERGGDQGEDDDEEEYQKSPQNANDKMMCLYCDKKFMSHNMQMKHVEKFHTQLKDRRCSGRYSQMSHHENSKKHRAAPAANPSLQHNFPGCTFCKKSKLPLVATPVKDLNGLFLHLTECHADKYFGCKLCMVRFQNIAKLSKHMQTVHKNMPFVFDECSKSKDNDAAAMDSATVERNKLSKTRLQKVQKTSLSSTTVPVTTTTTASPSTSAAISPNTIIGAEEPILSRLGLTQNRLPNNRKGVRLRRETIIPDALLKSEQTPTFSSSLKVRSKSTKNPIFGGDAEVVFRVPTRTEILSCVFDDDFYKEVVPNVRKNLLYHIDGKILGCPVNAPPAINTTISKQPLRSMLVKSPVTVIGDIFETEIHAATSLAASTAFPTLLTAEQYGGDAASSKIRRPHTKHSWKWKWDSVKKFKLINEGGKIIKKVKQPMLGLRDLSKLDMWTQLTMRQKHELEQHRAAVSLWQRTNSTSKETAREEKQRLNEQLNFILDLRLLPHIILEQNEQAIIKLENDEFGIALHNSEEDCTDNFLRQTFADESFLSVLHLRPLNELYHSRSRLVLSGEWARPRCYLCMCCGAKFEKLKSLEEHKMFRHSHILSTHYEVVGRELLAGNLLRHLFIPKRALTRYENESSMFSVSSSHRFAWRKNDFMLRGGTINITAEDESSDSVQSLLHSNCTTRTFSIKNSTTANNTTTDDCDDTDTKTTLDIINTVSPSHSMQSSSSSFAAAPLVQMQSKQRKELSSASSCTKCQRKCNGVLDLYRHMLDCSGDYIWTLAKKRKYRYYCGSKKRRPCNKHNFAELRKTKQKNIKAQQQQQAANDTEDSGSNLSKTKTPPRPRPSDAESIKKMLENLPPKRVCKKIFPTVTKAKKSKKSKLIAKHKLYTNQVLMKTRARQISQTGKLLSKTKTQFPKKTRNKKGIKILKRKNTTLSGTPKNDNHPSAEAAKPIALTDNVGDGSGSSKEKEVLANENKSNEEKVVDTPPNTSKDNSFELALPSNVFNSEVRLDQVTCAKEQQPAIAPATKSFSDLPSNTCVEPQIELQITTTSIPTVDSSIKITSPQVDNCNKKRSKKISDCIAMLTGKLEEKLKTEQKVVSTTEMYTEAVECKTNASVSELKKTPKRKTISRRIIKPEVLSAKLPVTPQPQAVIVPLPQPQPQQQPPPAKALSKKCAPALPSAVATKIPISVKPFAMTPQLAPIVAEPLPPVALAMLPKYPVYIPVEKLGSTAAAPPPPLPTLPLPLTLPLPVAASAERFPPKTVPPPPAATLIHVSPVMRPPPPAPPLFTIEPLNLSSSNNSHQQNASQDLTCSSSGQHRSGIPARRQTICGFEARNFIGFDDMEPLDLSKKSKYDPTPTPQMKAAVLEVAPILMPLKPNEAVVNLPLAAMTLPPEALLSKHFYSNLDLLKIPQVRNPVYIPPPVNELPNIAPKSTPTKKRNNNSKCTVAATANAELSIKPIAAINAQAKSLVKELPPLPPVHNKKENSAKNKVVQKMDEVVNNHIDDAINSVINAVQDSLPDEKEFEVPTTRLNVVNRNEALVKELQLPQKSISFNDQTTTILKEVKVQAPAPVPSKPLMMPLKRCMRSKTLDCRPAALNAHMMAGIILPQRSVSPSPLPSKDNAKSVDCVVEASTSVVNNTPSVDLVCVPAKGVSKQVPPTKSISEQEEIPIERKKVITGVKVDMATTKLDTGEKSSFSTACPLPEDSTYKIVSSTSLSDERDRELVPQPEPKPEKVIKFVEIESIPDVPTNDGLPLAMSHDINVNSISEENMSNINNTSSGFHSSGQLEVVADSKKKQRRRRKNELAAIVADQLLESFKIDNARRDNLKKLENLAYEKSEDLFVTGMLLMSSTKRTASMAANAPSIQTAGHDKTPDSTKRTAKQDHTKSLRSKSKTTEKVFVEDKPDKAAVKSIEIPVKTVEVVKEKEKEPEPEPKTKAKRRTYRRRGKALDNENISKLKSSLESFSIGIERQLSEIEAKNANIFNVAEGKTRNAAAVSAAPTKTSILRPSILSVTLDQPNASKGDGKSAVSSRDPRLNKNIHKEDEYQAVDIGKPQSAVATTSSNRRLRSSADENNLGEICDFEEDNYLTEIAKNVNDKIMSAENEEFVFANDGFEMANDMQDDSNSKYSRPPTSMSVRSAPNFNDDRSNFGSICDENTNTEVMDMDLDDELSVYTSFSQDVGLGGRGRRRRRRRSILLKRKPKKRPDRDLSAETFECALCKKTFFAANSLAKHNMTLAHVSKVSEQEYLLSKSINSITKKDEPHKRSPPQLSHAHAIQHNPLLKSTKEANVSFSLNTTVTTSTTTATTTNAIETPRAIREDMTTTRLTNECQTKPTETSKEKLNSFNSSTSRLTLNPDERLFFECCNILKGAETPRVNSEDCNNGTATTYTYSYQDKTPSPCMSGASLKPPPPNNDISLHRKQSTQPERSPSFKTLPAHSIQQNVFRDPQMIPATSFNKVVNTTNELNMLSPNYSAISQFSAVTNTTSRFKTKAAMKGYENVNIDLTIQQELETKSRTVCKLTELAEIALGNEKPSSPEYTPMSDNRDDSNPKAFKTPEYITSSVADNIKDCNMHLSRDRPKNNDTQSSTSSKTIMHSSIIKAAVEEHNKVPSGKIIIPERPFKNIGLEEKATITFQKPKTTVNLLTDDNSVSTASYSDRDDFDFGSISCDDDNSIKTSNEKIIKNNSSDSSSSRATAKTFENKSLIMGRIFKNASTKPKCAVVKVKSVGVQKDQAPKADLNQLFDELRGDAIAGGKTKSSEATVRKEFNSAITEDVKDKHNTPAVLVEPPTTRKSKDTRSKKSNVGRKSRKDISKLQSELGMSPEDLEKLIDEGQRKSKRRCATNRPKKLVEIWSSDEYEEFLSTKDIIALIEEKEKQEKRKKRKNSLNQSNPSEIKEKDLDSSHTSQAENKRKSVRSSSITERREKVIENSVKEKAVAEKKEKKSLTSNSFVASKEKEKQEKHTRNSLTSETATASKSKNIAIGKVNHNSTSSNRLKNKKNNSTSKTKNVDHIVQTVISDSDASPRAPKTKPLKIPHAAANSKKQTSTTPLDEDDDDFRLSDLKRNNNHKTRNAKEIKDLASSREDVNSFKAFKEPETTEVSKKRNSNKTYKNKRKTQPNQSPPRQQRKRLASEKLYYWSSSSDEDFGRINNTSHAQEFESGEQYQKHGWIVGDSHKKLVTLLAIAKGNKKVENCGVKKNISKKKT